MEPLNQELEERNDTILVNITPFFVQNSTSKSNQGSIFCWTYKVTISNKTTYKINLLRQEWIAFDEKGTKTTITDTDIETLPQENIFSNEAVEYGGLVNLSTPSGMMFGQYIFKTETGDFVEINTGGISLDSISTYANEEIFKKIAN